MSSFRVSHSETDPIIFSGMTKPLRILLVEDDAMICSLLAELLEAMGHVICGIEATEAGAVRAGLLERPDLMIVDAHLKHGSGLAAVDTIARSVAIPHIFMSGMALPEARPSSLLLLKPFAFGDLVRAIESVSMRPERRTGCALADQA